MRKIQRYVCKDVQTQDKYHFKNVDGDVMIWLYIHYVDMDHPIQLMEWNENSHVYEPCYSDDGEQVFKVFTVLLHSMKLLSVIVEEGFTDD